MKSSALLIEFKNISSNFLNAFVKFFRFYRITTVGNERMLLEPRRKSKKLPVIDIYSMAVNLGIWHIFENYGFKVEKYE